MQCVRHADVETELGCSRCGVAICPRCMVHTPVGARCPDCAQVRRIPTYNIPTKFFVRAIAAAIVGGLVVGFVWAFFNVGTYFFFGAFAGLAVGLAVGQLVSLATNRKAGPPLQAIAVGGVVVAYLARVGLLFAIDGWVFADLRTDLWGLLAAGIACFVAAGRLR